MPSAKKLQRVIFEGPSHVLRIDEYEIRRGEEAELPRDVVERLLAVPRISLSVVSEEEAHASGVEETEALDAQESHE